MRHPRDPRSLRLPESNAHVLPLVTVVRGIVLDPEIGAIRLSEPEERTSY